MYDIPLLSKFLYLCPHTDQIKYYSQDIRWDVTKWC